MTEIEIKQLQTEKRFSDANLKNIYLILYTPVGIIVLLLRIIVGVIIIILGNILPDVSLTKSVLTQLFRACFGIVIHTDRVDNKRDVKVIISNHISPLDHFVVHIATGCITPNQTNLPTPISYSLGWKDFGSTANLDVLKKCINNFNATNTIPLLFQPENRITNGKGVLKFQDWPFSFTNDVQPIYLQLRRPVFDISVTTITSSYWNDLFWYLYSPWTVYNICFLPVNERKDLTDTEFAEQVRQEIASGLNVEACSYSKSDVIEWEKRYLLEQRRARMVYRTTSNTSQSNNPELHRMARQVKEVLPTVPYNVIFKDLVRTKNVDLTISNILEGHVMYVPEEIPSPTSSQASVTQLPTQQQQQRNTPISQIPSSSSSSATLKSTAKEANVKHSLCTAAQAFPKSAQERMQSFQERKLQLIMNARQRYIDKHGLNALASNDC